MNKEGLEDLASKMTDRVVELEAQVLALQTQLEKLKGHSTAVPSEHGARSTASGTPRTDEATRLMQFADAEEQYEVVTSYFARQLETENAAFRAQLERVERERPIVHELEASAGNHPSATKAALIELLRLYDWRNEVGGAITEDQARQYGREKKAAWEVARKVLSQ